MRIRLRCLAWLMLIFSPGVHARAAGSESTFLVVERPAALVFYDRYQQSLDEQARSALPHYLPMRLLDARDLLGDGLTPCMKVEIQGNTYFVLREDGDRLVGESKAGRIAQFSGSRALGDTVVIIRGSRIPFEAPSTGQQEMLGSGEKLTRIFSVGSKTYVERQSKSGYGWVELSVTEKAKSWEIVVPEYSLHEPLLIDRVQDTVRTRIDNANRILRQLFQYFNSAMHLHMAPPQWRVRLAGSTITCVLEETETPEAFRESTALLARNFGSLILGSAYTIETRPGRIVIRPG